MMLTTWICCISPVVAMTLNYLSDNAQNPNLEHFRLSALQAPHMPKEQDEEDSLANMLTPDELQYVLSTQDDDMRSQLIGARRTGRSVLFTKGDSNGKGVSWGSAKMRADDVAYIINAMTGWRAISMSCVAYIHDICGREDVNDIQIVINVKYTCPCNGSKVTRIYDPIDAFVRTPGLPGFVMHARKDEYDAYIVANHVLRTCVLDAGAPKAFVIPHHHSNAQHRLSSVREPADSPLVIGIAGQDVNASQALIDTLSNASWSKNVSLHNLQDIQCHQSKVLPPFRIGDCFAMKGQRLDLGIAWQQSFVEWKWLENSAQRLSNLLSVGVPTVGFAGYASYSELMVNSHRLKLASNVSDLYNQLYALVDNTTLRQAAQQEATVLASRHSPSKVAALYEAMFKALGH